MDKVCQCLNCFKYIQPEKGYVRVEDKYFCPGQDCVTEHLNIENRLRLATDNFNEDRLYPTSLLRYDNKEFQPDDEG